MWVSYCIKNKKGQYLKGIINNKAKFSDDKEEALPMTYEMASKVSKLGSIAVLK